MQVLSHSFLADMNFYELLPTIHRNVQLVSSVGFKGGSIYDENVITNFSNVPTLRIASVFPVIERKIKKKKKTRSTISGIICALRGNKPTTHGLCHFSMRLHAEQNDFVVHHRLNSAENVINLYKS